MTSIVSSEPSVPAPLPPAIRVSPPWLVAQGVPEIGSAEFNAVRAMLYEIAGISLQEGKEGLVRSRLGARLRARDLPTIKAYVEFVKSDRSGEELVHMVDVLTTNKTSFFREAEHFRFLESDVLPGLAARRGTIRVWSAGCSSGEEAYTLAMVLRESIAAERLHQTKILATDISTRVLARAKAAVYAADALAEMPTGWGQRHFVRHEAPDGAGRPAVQVGPRMRVIDATRQLVTVARLNLMGDWPMRGQFDVIFCRNVMIYFDRPTQERLVRRFAELLTPGGYLFVGHSESLNSLEHGLNYCQPAVYRR